MASLTFAQEITLQQQCYEPVNDPTLLSAANHLAWDGKVMSLPALVAEKIESAYVKTTPESDCMTLGVCTIVTKIAAKDIQLANALNTMLADQFVPYSYSAVLRTAENWM